MEIETDPFKKKVLDGLQLAFKITANSLYGQTGAPTSPLYMKEIAACTTATGREMLNYSKHFVENIFSNIVNNALDDKEKYIEFMEETYQFNDTFNYTPKKENYYQRLINVPKKCLINYMETNHYVNYILKLTLKNKHIKHFSLL